MKATTDHFTVFLYLVLRDRLPYVEVKRLVGLMVDLESVDVEGYSLPTDDLAQLAGALAAEARR